MILPLFLAAAAQAVIPSGDVRFDVRCAIVTQSAFQQAEDELKSALMMSMMFYFGRLDAVLADEEIAETFEEEAALVEGQPLGPLLERCGKYMEQRGKKMEEVGNEMLAREQVDQLN